MTQRTKACGMDRRDLLCAMAAAGVGATTLSTLMRAAAAGDQLSVLSWGGYDIAELAPAYYAAHGSPNFSLMASDEEGFQKVRAGYQPDIAHHTSYIVRRLIGADMIQPIDPARLVHWHEFFPELLAVGEIDGQNWIAPFSWGNVSVIYRQDLIADAEQSWGMLFDDRYAGRIAMRDDAGTAMIICALYLGAADPRNMTDEELGAAKALLLRQKPMLRFYWTGQSDLEQSLASGEVIVADGWNASVALLRSEDVDMAMMQPKEGIITWSDGLVYYRNSSAPEELAYEFFNAYMAPEVGQFLIEAYGYASGNMTVYPDIPEATLVALSIANPADILQNSFFAKGLDPAVRQRYEAAFEEVKAAG
jgi:spermidine/putrescine transport system substrate-binding protein